MTIPNFTAAPEFLPTDLTARNYGPNSAEAIGFWARARKSFSTFRTGPKSFDNWRKIRAKLFEPPDAIRNDNFVFLSSWYYGRSNRLQYFSVASAVTFVSPRLINELLRQIVNICRYLFLFAKKLPDCKNFKLWNHRRRVRNILFVSCLF